MRHQRPRGPPAGLERTGKGRQGTSLRQGYGPKARSCPIREERRKRVQSTSSKLSIVGSRSCRECGFCGGCGFPVQLFGVQNPLGEKTAAKTVKTAKTLDLHPRVGVGKALGGWTEGKREAKSGQRPAYALRATAGRPVASGVARIETRPPLSVRQASSKDGKGHLRK